MPAMPDIPTHSPEQTISRATCLYTLPAQPHPSGRHYTKSYDAATLTACVAPTISPPAPLRQPVDAAAIAVPVVLVFAGCVLLFLVFRWAANTYDAKRPAPDVGDDAGPPGGPASPGDGGGGEGGGAGGAGGGDGSVRQAPPAAHVKTRKPYGEIGLSWRGVSRHPNAYKPQLWGGYWRDKRKKRKGYIEWGWDDKGKKTIKSWRPTRTRGEGETSKPDDKDGGEGGTVGPDGKKQKCPDCRSTEVTSSPLQQICPCCKWDNVNKRTVQMVGTQAQGESVEMKNLGGGDGARVRFKPEVEEIADGPSIIGDGPRVVEIKDDGSGTGDDGGPPQASGSAAGKKKKNGQGGQPNLSKESAPKSAAGTDDDPIRPTNYSPVRSEGPAQPHEQHDAPKPSGPPPAPMSLSELGRRNEAQKAKDQVEANQQGQGNGNADNRAPGAGQPKQGGGKKKNKKNKGPAGNVAGQSGGKGPNGAAPGNGQGRATSPPGYTQPAAFATENAEIRPEDSMSQAGAFGQGGPPDISGDGW